MTRCPRLYRKSRVVDFQTRGMERFIEREITKLGRDVTNKVLPEEFARDKERLDRFERVHRIRWNTTLARRADPPHLLDEFSA